MWTKDTLPLTWDQSDPRLSSKTTVPVINLKLEDLTSSFAEKHGLGCRAVERCWTHLQPKMEMTRIVPLANSTSNCNILLDQMKVVKEEQEEERDDDEITVKMESLPWDESDQSSEERELPESLLSVRPPTITPTKRALQTRLTVENLLNSASGNERMVSSPKLVPESAASRRPQQDVNAMVDTKLAPRVAARDTKAKNHSQRAASNPSLGAPPDDHADQESTPDSTDCRKSSELGKQKPRRPCVFCLKMNSRLPRHYECVHADEPEIKRIKKMTPKKRVHEYATLRIQGIYEHNLRELGKKSPRLLTERKLKPATKIVSCKECKKFIQSKTFYAHVCTRKKFKHSGIPVECMTTDEDSKKFHLEILKQIRNDEIGIFAKSDETVQLFGIRLFRKINNLQKKTEQRHGVMAHMRKLTKLYFEFRSSAASDGKRLEVMDMFYYKNYTYIKAGFEAIGGDTLGAKRSNARLEHCSTLLKAAKKLKTAYFILQDDSKVAALTSFGDFFKSERSDLFGEDEDVVSKQREVKPRQPKTLPLDRVIGKLRNFCVARTEEIMLIKGNSKDKYIELRRLLVCRLTFLNGRGGGEPARLLREQMQMAIDGVGLASPNYDRVRAMNKRYKDLLDNFILAYHAGKTNGSWVPVFIPRSSLPAIMYVMDYTNRREAGVLDENPFLFPMTACSESHAVSSSEGKHICNKIGAPVDLTATCNRHRVSTIFATKDVLERDIEIFFKHMDHSSKMKIKAYQAPSIKNVLVSWDHLDSMDQFGGDSETLKPSTSNQANTSKASKVSVQSTSRKRFEDSSDDDTSTDASLVKQKIKTSDGLPRPKTKDNQPTTATDALQESSCRSSDISGTNESDTTQSGSYVLPIRKENSALLHEDQPLACSNPSQIKKERKRIKWAENDNKIIEYAFKTFIYMRGEGGQGPLPKKAMINSFLNQESVVSVTHLTPQKKIQGCPNADIQFTPYVAEEGMSMKP